MPLGVAATDSGCVYLSGCSSIGSDGIDYAGYFYDLMQECEQACEPMGIDLPSSAPFQIFPNPSSGWITISTQRGIRQWSVWNTAGQLIITSQDNQADLTQLPQGMYWIQIEDRQGYKAVQKWMKQ
jgi:hypothetical protein